jgi:hypothetical protein
VIANAFHEKSPLAELFKGKLFIIYGVPALHGSPVHRTFYRLISNLNLENVYGKTFKKLLTNPHHC